MFFCGRQTGSLTGKSTASLLLYLMRNSCAPHPVGPGKYNFFLFGVLRDTVEDCTRQSRKIQLSPAYHDCIQQIRESTISPLRRPVRLLVLRLRRFWRLPETFQKFPTRRLIIPCLRLLSINIASGKSPFFRSRDSFPENICRIIIMSKSSCGFTA